MTTKIGIVLASIREPRFGIHAAEFIYDIASQRTDIEVELIDMRDYVLGMFGESLEGPAEAYHREAVSRWGTKLESMDGFVFVTPEYNHSIPSNLKNGLDFAGVEPMKHKPATFVGYGPIGSARAIEQLRLILIELEVAPLRKATHIGMEPFLAVRENGQSLSEFSFLVDRANVMLDELVWWTNALQKAREESGELITS